MKRRLVRVSRVEEEIENFPLKRVTMYKWHRDGWYPEMFVKLGGAVFLDVDVFEDWVAGRLEE